MILIPVLILQIFLFPMFVNVVMTQYVNDQKSLALQEAASYLSSSIEQVYLSLNHTSIVSSTLTNNLGPQPLIDGYAYTGNATLANWVKFQPSSGCYPQTRRYKHLNLHFGHAGAKRQMGKIDIHERLVISLYNRREISRSSYPAFVRNINGDKICRAYL